MKFLGPKRTKQDLDGAPRAGGRNTRQTSLGFLFKPPETRKTDKGAFQAAPDFRAATAPRSCPRLGYIWEAVAVKYQKQID